MRKAQEELTQQKEVIVAQDKELKVNPSAVVGFRNQQLRAGPKLIHVPFQGKSSEANKLREQNNEVQLKIKELEHNINKHRKDSQDAADKVQRSPALTRGGGGPRRLPRRPGGSLVCGVQGSLLVSWGASGLRRVPHEIERKRA